MVSADPVRLFEALVESGQVGGGEPVGGPRLLIELPSGSRLVAESPLQFSDGGGFGKFTRFWMLIVISTFCSTILLKE